jgi:hypothetical protein
LRELSNAGSGVGKVDVEEAPRQAPLRISGRFIYRASLDEERFGAESLLSSQ